MVQGLFAAFLFSGVTAANGGIPVSGKPDFCSVPAGLFRKVLAKCLCTTMAVPAEKQGIVCSREKCYKPERG